jgi:PAS domain S-box-containing protein
MSTKKKILIVEDESLVAEDLKEIIISLGYTVIGITDNSTAAIILARETSPDLITMDINISGSVDGISTMEQIRKESDVPVIYVTALTTDTIVERAKKTKPSGYIIKPFNERQIRLAFEIALYNTELERKVTERDTMIRALINATTDPFLLIDTTGTIRAGNEAIARRLGRHAEELTGMHIRQMVEAGAISGQFASSVTKALEGTDVRFEESFRDIWYDVHFIPITDPQGRVSMMAVFSNDISFRKQAEDQIRIVNGRLITERNTLRQTQEELRSLNTRLEEKVKERTAELENANGALTEQNRTLKISNAGTRALLSVHDEAGFMPHICNDLVRSGGYSHVWLAGFDAKGNIGIVAAAGYECPGFSAMLANKRLPVCTDKVRTTGGGLGITMLDPTCASCPLSMLHMDCPTIITRLDIGEKSVALLGVTLQPGVTLSDHETVRIGQVAQEIAFVIHYLRTKEREQRAYDQITKNLEQLAILNDHVRNPLQGIIGYASMGEGELFTKIIKLSTTINSIVTKLDEGYLESKKIRDFMERHEHIVLHESDRKSDGPKRTGIDISSHSP